MFMVVPMRHVCLSCFSLYFIFGLSCVNSNINLVCMYITDLKVSE